MAKNLKFNDEKYNKAIEQLGKQLAAMVLEDNGGEDEMMLDDYLAVAIDEIRSAAEKHIEDE